jgi:tetratricopeptide (TPR) repeat protein
MPRLHSLFRSALTALAALALVLWSPRVLAQGGGGGGGGGGGASPLMREASQLDSDGNTKRAREIFQRLIDSAATPRATADAQRAMAMSYGFDHDCDNAIKYETMVIAYHVTREKEFPQDAYYQQGEMANEAARICIDAGKLDLAETWYRKGSELGNVEPEPRTHPRSLWDYRLAHALARLAAQRGNKAEAQRQVEAARRALDSDTAMARPQERFFPYLTGYVALFTNDLKTAEAELTRAIGIAGNSRDPFMHYLLAMTYEKSGQSVQAREFYQKSYEMATGHNPPAAFTRTAARKKLALAPQ